MKTLTGEQIEFIRNNLKKRPISRSFLFNEYVDHICCDIERQMDKGKSFDEAFRLVTASLPDTEITMAHKETVHLLNAKFVWIKKILYLSAAIFVISWLINQPVIAGWTGLISFFVLGSVYLIAGIDFLREARAARVNILLSVLGFLSFVGTTLGIILIFLNRNYGINTRGHGPDAMVFGWFFFSLLCLLYFYRDYKTSIEQAPRQRNRLFTWLSLLNLVLAIASIASFPLYNKVENYLFYFILFILAFDLVCITWLAVRRYFKYILMAALFTGSFMLVFIHSPFRQKLPGGQPEMNIISVNVYPSESPDRETIFLYCYYDQYPTSKFTIPMRRSPAGYYTNSWPSFPYKGYLVCMVGTDSIDAGRAFLQPPGPVDSILLDIPGTIEYSILVEQAFKLNNSNDR